MWVSNNFGHVRNKGCCNSKLSNRPGNETTVWGDSLNSKLCFGESRLEYQVSRH